MIFKIFMNTTKIYINNISDCRNSDVHFRIDDCKCQSNYSIQDFDEE